MAPDLLLHSNPGEMGFYVALTFVIPVATILAPVVI